MQNTTVKEGIKMEQLTRRKFIETSLFAGAAATAFSLAGCGNSEENSEEKSLENTFDLSGNYLPLGSVVYIKRYQNTDVPLLIVSRKPLVTTPAEEQGDKVYDYAAVIQPFGIQGDLSNHEDLWELITFNSEDISKILFVGYINEQEEQAAATLQANRDTSSFGVSLLLDQFNGMWQQSEAELSKSNENN